MTVLLLGAAGTAWAAEPMPGTGGWGILLVVLASLGVAAGTAHLVVGELPGAGGGLGPRLFEGLVEWLNAFLSGPRWEVVTSVALVVLEALHPARPWHTGLLSLLLLCYFLALQRAEAAVPAQALRGQAKALALSVALVAMVTGVAMLPSAGTGALAAWLEIIAAVAAMVAGGLALPL